MGIGISGAGVSGSFFTELAAELAGALGLITVLAALGILFTSIRIVLNPDAEDAAKIFNSIRRKLTVLLFISMLGFIIASICGDFGASPMGLMQITNLF